MAAAGQPGQDLMNLSVRWELAGFLGCSELSMEKAILFAVLASFCTATASICQRIGARSSETAGFDIWLVFRLARRPVWLLGVASMIGGFLFQLSALKYGALALVQPILAVELLLVFGYMAVAGAGRVRVQRRDWLAAAAMSAGIAVFLRLASPSGGQLHAPAGTWLLAGLITLGAVLLLLALAFGLGGKELARKYLEKRFAREATRDREDELSPL